METTIIGDGEVLAALAKIARTGKKAMMTALGKASRVVTNKAKRSYLTGQSLKVRSGTLRSSLRHELDSSKLEARVGTNVVYARIHEFGGTTSPHEIRPRHGKVLRFPVPGGFAFAKSIQHPGSVMPARPWLRPAYETSQDAIADEFRQALAGVLQP